jgi:uncharacterized membrane protein YecN with MAPEG domain
VGLYDLRAIDLATFLASWFAGAFLIARNLRALNRPEEARNALIAGTIALIPLAFVAHSLVVPVQYERLLGIAVQGAQVWVVHIAASRIHGKALINHAAADGRFFSRWRAVGVSILLLPVPLLVVVSVALLFPDLPALAE